MAARLVLVSSLMFASLALAGCADDLPDAPSLAGGAPSAGAAARAAEVPAINPRLLRRFRPIRRDLDRAEGHASPEQITLGQMLFFDTRLSKARDLSCNSCHALTRYGVDSKPTSTGHLGAQGSRNAPSVFHAAGHTAQFWDGRSPDVEAQAAGPILNHSEMAMDSPKEVTARLAAIPGYVTAFAKAFPDDKVPLSFENVGRALGAFERELVAPARWDRFLEGDERALTAAEVEGLKLFADIGCVECHTGEFLGGSMMRKLGVQKPWPSQADQGRFAVTGLEVDRMMFKVPSLRNVELSGPYFHDGSVASLDECVRLMARHQLGLELTDAEASSLIAWLKTLTGELPAEYVAAPPLPPDP